MILGTEHLSNQHDGGCSLFHPPPNWNSSPPIQPAAHDGEVPGRSRQHRGGRRARHGDQQHRASTELIGGPAWGERHGEKPEARKAGWKGDVCSWIQVEHR